MSSTRNEKSNNSNTRRSMLPVPQSKSSQRPTPICHNVEHSRTSKSSYTQGEPKTPKKSSRVENKKQPPPTTPSLSFPRSVSASHIETRPRVKPKQPLSYNGLSQENHVLQSEVSSLRSLLQQVEFEKIEQQTTLQSEVKILSQDLEEATASISQLSNDVTTQKYQITKLVAVLENKGINPISGDEVTSREESIQTSITAAEKTKRLSESLKSQNYNYSVMLDQMRGKRMEMLNLLSQEERDALIVNKFSVTDLEYNYTPGVITEEPLAI